MSAFFALSPSPSPDLGRGELQKGMDSFLFDNTSSLREFGIREEETGQNGLKPFPLPPPP
ncbi:MAG: hypothetical protein AB7H80_08795 [Candidatus Kapaibacterium sp.]